jgi:hypothetical protein
MRVKDLLKRKGIIRITQELIFGLTDAEYHDIFHDLIIIDAQTEHLYGTPTVRYVCLHKEFIEVEEGFLIPEYNIEITKDIHKNWINFKKIEKDDTKNKENR